MAVIFQERGEFMAGKKNSSEAAFDRDAFLLELAGGCVLSGETLAGEDYDEGIAEIQAMIRHFLDLGDLDEVAQWRRLLQRTKVEKRRMTKLVYTEEVLPA